MTAAAQAAQLVRLRQVRMQAAARALAEAREATASAQLARAAADDAATAADARHRAAKEGLAADLSETERLLAVLDQAMFRRSVADGALSQALDAEAECATAEAERRKAMIVAQARHDVIAAEVAKLRRGAQRRDEERAAMDSEDLRRFR